MVSREFLRRVFLRDRAISLPLSVAVLLQLITWGLLLWRGLPLRGATAIPLHYSIYFGIDLVGPWYGLYYLPAIGLAAFVVNTVLLVAGYERHRMSSYLLAGGTAFFSLTMLAASITTLLLNL